MATSTPINGPLVPVLLPAAVQGDDVLAMVDVHDLTDPLGTMKQATVDAVGYYAIPKQGRTVGTLPAYLANNAVFNVLDDSATGNGTTDDSAALLDAQTKALGLGILCLTLPKTASTNGTYKVDATIVFTIALQFMPGAILAPTAGHTITCAGNILADPTHQIFTTGFGTIVVSGTDTVYPEWWGAKADNSTDCTTAIVAGVNAVTATLTAPGTVQFQAGTYCYTALGNLACTGLQLFGAGMEATNLFCTGMGTSNHALHFDAWPSGTPPYVMQCNVQDLTVVGNTNITSIIYAQGLARCHWKNVSVREADATTGIGFDFFSVNLSTFDTLICSTNLQAMTHVPQDGFRLNVGSRNSINMGNCSDNTWINCYGEGMTERGCRILAGDQNTYLGGSFEANNTYDLTVADGSRYNTFLGTGFESVLTPLVATANISDAGQYTHFLNCYTNNAVIFAATARQCILEGGTHQNITVQSGANGVVTQSLGVNKLGSGVYSDSGTNTQWKLLWDLTNAVYLFPYNARTSISVTASPFTFTNTAALPVQVFIQSGTVSQVQGKRGSDTWLLAPTPPQAYLVQPSDSLVVTYSVGPSMSQLPVNGF